MKTLYIFAFLLFSSAFLYSQLPVKADTIKPEKGNVDKQLEKINDRKVNLHSDVKGNEPKKSRLIDTTVYNRYGDLLNDDTVYNKKYPIWKPVADILGIVTVNWSINRFYSNTDFSHIGISTWKYNIKTGWEWDIDRFGVNFIGHPYSGSLTFNAARSNGYNYYQSAVFSTGGSLIWEYFGENTRPSYNDVINTPINGAFLGEIFYRLSSNILDDRTSGAERFFRELAAGIVDPMRGINRLLQGKSFRTTNKEVYQKEPLNISIFAGVHRINDESHNGFGNKTYSEIINLQLDYGNPFEIRSRKPFDFFKLRGDLNFGVGRKFVDNIIGYGLLFGKNMQVGNLAILVGCFQYYDYWDNKTFELGAIGFGPGLITKLPLSNTSNLNTKFHLAIVPFAGNSTQFGPDTSQVRDYNFGDGLEGKIESTVNFADYADISLVYYYYMIHTYVGAPGSNFISILKPRITVKIYKDLSIGFEHFIYFNDRYLRDFPAIHSVRTEQKLFLLIYLEDSQRRGHYN
ncbi:MAG: DUF3943 domain-containing protein [Bacteroidia bacterium]|nr:DUF3943 domain-containing protein [Bacteroidia bacterium]